MKPYRGIVFFDGHCHLCNRWVNFLLNRRHRERFRFAPLQGTTARANEEVQRMTDTIVYLRGDKLYDRSNAVLRIAGDLGGLWPVMWTFAIFPRFVRDYFYRIIARNRYRWFGRSESCRMPSPKEKALFLD
ncbi:MAG: DUF393 domain-containing protein [Flavobacteriales bacterium]|nr:DUF393 domain-containing protein [Flavobacteriales bacterium]